MVLRIWLIVLILTTLYYGNRLYGDSFYPESGAPAPHVYKLNHDD